MDYWDQYAWIVVVGALLAFFTAYGIGANDVANAFATSVGSKALSLKQAIIIAGVFEFAGSVLMGAGVTDTIRKNIANRDVFEDDPEVLMFGMMCVLAATGLWLVLASYLELPVSTTHSVIGGIIGMSMAAHGSDAVIWAEYDPDKEALKKFKGVVPVIASWVISPVLSGIIAVGLFLFVRTFVLRHENSLQRAYIFFPFLVGATIAVNTYFIIYKGFKRKIGKNKEALSDILGVGYSSLIAWGLGAVVGLVLYFTFIPWLRSKIENGPKEGTTDDSVKHDGVLKAGEDKPKSPKEVEAPRVMEEAGKGEKGVFEIDLHAMGTKDTTVQEMHVAAEQFDWRTEEAFKYLQVFTAMMDSFSHGANDVANSIGPFAAIWDIYRHQEVSKKSSVPEWILVLGGLGIVVGLATYGYKIMCAMGVKLVKVSASRGFAIELGAAVVIVTGSRYGIPLSTTHCQVGATVGVGWTEGKGGVNYRLLAKVILGWIITLVVVGLTSAAFFAEGAFAPSIPNLRAVKRYDDGIAAVVGDMASFLNGTDPKRAAHAAEQLQATREVFTDISEAQIDALNSTWLAAEGTCAN